MAREKQSISSSFPFLDGLVWVNLESGVNLRVRTEPAGIQFEGRRFVIDVRYSKGENGRFDWEENDLEITDLTHIDQYGAVEHAPPIPWFIEDRLRNALTEALNNWTSEHHEQLQAATDLWIDNEKKRVVTLMKALDHKHAECMAYLDALCGKMGTEVRLPETRLDFAVIGVPLEQLGDSDIIDIQDLFTKETVQPGGE